MEINTAKKNIALFSKNKSRLGILSKIVSRLFSLTFLILISTRSFAQNNSPLNAGNPLLWLSSDTGVVLNGTNVQQWLDRSGNNNTALQNTPSNQPSITFNQINNKPCLHFGKSGSTGDQTYLSLPQINLTSGDFTIFCFYKPNTVTNAIHFILGSNGQGISSGGGSFPGLVIFDGTNLLQSTSSYTSPLLSEFTSSSIYKNGTQLTTTGAPVSNISINTIGSRPDFLSGFFYGDIYEILIYDTQLSDSARGIVENYIYEKYAPSVNLGLDTTVCSLPFTLKAAKNYFTNYEWQDNSTNDSLVINSNGNYSLTTTDIFGRISSDTITISKDISNYTVNLGADTAICAGQQLTLNAGLPLYNYSWSNGSFSNLTTVNATGTYYVSVTDCNANVSKDTITILVNPIPTFSLGNDTLACYNSTFILKPDFTSSLNYVFLWSNNSIDSTLNVTSSGNYWLKATDLNGCYYTDTINVSIDSLLSLVTLGPDVSICSGNYIFLSGSSPSITSYTWSDNSTNDSLQINNTIGNYTYWLTVKDNNNCSKTDSINVSVLGDAPLANFSFVDVCKGSAAQFTDQSTPPSGNSITNWLWDFGDGNTSNNQNPTNTYTSSGNYNIKLTVTTNIGCSEEINSPINIYPTPNSDYIYNSSSNPLFYSFYETGVSNGIPITNRVWRENGNISSFASSFNKNFPSVGNYNISLTLMNSKGCKDSVSKTIVVSNPSPVNIIPTSITGLKVWLRSDSNLVKNSNSVSSWTDISGNGFVFNSPNAASNPSYTSNNFNIKNKPSLIFDGTDDGLKSTTAIPLGNLGASVYVISKTPTFKPFGVSVAYGTGLSGSWNFIQRGTSSRITLINGSNNQGAGVSNSTSSDLTAKDFTILQGSLNDQTDKWKIGENSILKDSIISAFSQANSNFITIGYRDDGLGFCNTEIAEILIFDHELNSSENDKIIEYFRNRYTSKVDIGPPINNVCDTTVTLNTSNNYFSNIQWSNGVTASSITLNQADTISIVATDVFDFISRDTSVIQSFQTPFSIYTLPDTTFCSTSISWNPLLNSSNYGYLWSTGSNAPSIVISNTNTYSVVVNDTNGCAVHSPSVQVIKDDFRNIASLGPDITICAGNQIQLISGNNPSNVFHWNDNSTGDSLIVNSTGQYYVDVTNQNGCSASDTINVTVLGQAPTVNFSTGILCKNDSVNFNDLSVAPVGNTINTWHWDFGNNSSNIDTSNIQNPIYFYPDSGIYIVNLFVTTDVGCSQTYSTSVHVKQKPTANFASANLCQNSTSTFTSSSIGNGTTLSNYAWNFGDVSSGSNNQSLVANPSHVFSNSGNHNVTLIIGNQYGCYDTIVKTITLKQEVVADFTYTPACTNTSITFSDNSNVPSPYNSHPRSWNFGTAGGTSTNLNVVKNITVPGTYVITLNVNGTNGCNSSITKNVNVFLPPTANFSSSSLCKNQSILLNDNSFDSNGSISAWNWKENNTTFSTLQNPSFLGNIVGNHPINLEVTSNNGCMNNVTKNVTVFDLPNTDFTLTPSSFIYPGLSVSLSPNISPADSYTWTASNNFVSSNSNPNITFSDTGSYSISLNLTDTNSCSNSIIKNINVIPRNFDIGILSVNPTISNNYMQVQSVLVNYGSVTITDLNLEYHLKDASTLKEHWTGNLTPGSVLNYNFSAQTKLNNNENEFVCMQILDANQSSDDNPSNNTLCNTLNSSEFFVSNLFPNPASTDITIPIVVPTDGVTEIEITDVLGQSVFKNSSIYLVEGLNLYKIPVSNLLKGTFIAKITFGSKSQIKKFTVN